MIEDPGRGNGPTRVGVGVAADAGAQTPPAPKRGARRKRVLKGARLVLGGGLSTLDCTIKDISATGARVRLADITRISGRLLLAMPDGEMLDAEVIRNVGMEVGLRFCGDTRPSFAPPPDPLEVVIEALDRLPLDELIGKLQSLPVIEDSEVTEAVASVTLSVDRLKKVLRAHIKEW